MGYRYGAEQLVALLRDMPEQDRGRRDERVERNLGPRYVEHGEPACLVAHLLAELGVSIATLCDLSREGRQHDGGASEQLQDSRHPYWRRFEPSARQLLMFLQRVQDNGHTWGAAADEALSPTPREWWGKRWARTRPWLPADQ